VRDGSDCALQCGGTKIGTGSGGGSTQGARAQTRRLAAARLAHFNINSLALAPPNSTRCIAHHDRRAAEGVMRREAGHSRCAEKTWLQNLAFRHPSRRVSASPECFWLDRFHFPYKVRLSGLPQISSSGRSTSTRPQRKANCRDHRITLLLSFRLAHVAMRTFTVEFILQRSSRVRSATGIPRIVDFSLCSRWRMTTASERASQSPSI
jgi:hypothetical protein